MNKAPEAIVPGSMAEVIDLENRIRLALAKATPTHLLANWNQVLADAQGIMQGKPTKMFVGNRLERLRAIAKALDA